MSEGPTKAQLIERLEKAEADRDEAVTQANAWRDHKLADDESAAVAACVKALDKIAPQRSGYGSVSRGAKGDVGRVLRYLAERYGVPLAQPVATEASDDRAAAIRELTWNLRGFYESIGSLLTTAAPESLGDTG